MLITAGKTPILRDFELGLVLLQQFDDGKVHRCGVLSRKLSSVEFNYDIFDKGMLAIVYSLQQLRHFLKGSEFNTIIFMDHQNLSYFPEKVKLNQRQAHWVEILQEYSFCDSIPE